MNENDLKPAIDVFAIMELAEARCEPNLAAAMREAREQVARWKDDANEAELANEEMYRHGIKLYLQVQEVGRLISKWYERGDELAQQGGLDNSVVKAATDILDRCRHELAAALSALPTN